MEFLDNGIITVIGAGGVGLGWAAYFAARGYRVKLYDPREDWDQQVARSLPRLISQVPATYEDQSLILNRITMAHSLYDAVEYADLIQEAGPELVAFKQRLWKKIESLVDVDTLLVSSSSMVSVEDQAARMNAPERLMIGHAASPPHILPLVEVSAGAKTPPLYVDKLCAFYKRIGKEPVRLRREIPALVANRLQMALLAEAVKLVEEGVVSVKELDTVVTHAVGVRWAASGPFKSLHMDGGKGGIGLYLSRVGKKLAGCLGDPTLLADDVIRRLAEKTETAYPISDLTFYRDERDRRHSIIVTDRERFPD
ncbi:3-hydroxyacyl-CoA dehydrogenase NAD-binding domain-containing protein [Gallaecimonas mangrovi]|uniref:3-hydroxyacyl-CoA dehydrogenase NAD-binding domain-containing protein n=1 Tax=Gallaecimonas mangrovi TaxID=2291597 RepID=UPI000E2041DA|nr:3-hydroxyacyl-CoA dehydrogenase NAD-binding domain-containing protein [Gallaecimonas mangrovi]